MSEKCRKILASVGAVVLIVLISIAIADIHKKGVYDFTMELNYGWTLIFHGDTAKIESTGNYQFAKKIVKGDSLILRRKLSSNFPANPTLRFKTYLSFVEAYLDGRLLYSSGKKDFRNGVPVGSGIHFVNLGATSLEGKTLDFVFHFSENSTWNELPAFEVLPAKNAFSDFYAQHSVSLVVGAFLLLFGILTVFLSVGMAFYGLAFFRILMIGILANCLGVWTLCYTKLIQLFSFDFAFNTSLEYFSLYLAPLPLCLLLAHMCYNRINKYRWHGLVFLAFVNTLLVVVTTVLNFTNLVHFPNTLRLFHFFAFFCLIYLTFIGISDRKKLDAPTKILAAGVSLFGAVSVFELLRYYLTTQFHLDYTLLKMTWLPIGTLAFVILLGLSYIVYMYYLLTEKTKKDILSKIAYQDSLTDLYNRAKCQQIFGVLDKGTSDFAIASIDMNGLKLVNDRYGHKEGDRLIKTFANVFHEAFEGIGTTIRMGGDEFVAIIRYEHLAEVDATLAKMAELQKNRGADLPIPLEAAFGIAYRHELIKNEDETENNNTIKAEKVYQLADERMYAMKAAMKSELVRR